MTTIDNNRQQNNNKQRVLCECGKSLADRHSLCKHKKICKFLNPQPHAIQQNNDMLKTMMEFMKQQSQQQAEVMKTMAENMGNRTTNNKTTNKQVFNINNYLNNECKDAINMSDFKKNFEFTKEHLELCQMQGLEKGITKAIMDNLHKLPITDRPIVCSDIKREVLYIKDDGEWCNDSAKDKFKELANKAQTKGFVLMNEYIKSRPNFYKDENSKDYISTNLSTFGKSLDEQNVSCKILKNVCNETYVKDSIMKK